MQDGLVCSIEKENPRFVPFLPPFRGSNNTKSRVKELLAPCEDYFTIHTVKWKTTQRKWGSAEDEEISVSRTI